MDWLAGIFQPHPFMAGLLPAEQQPRQGHTGREGALGRYLGPNSNDRKRERKERRATSALSSVGWSRRQRRHKRALLEKEKVKEEEGEEELGEGEEWSENEGGSSPVVRQTTTEEPLLASSHVQLSNSGDRNKEVVAAVEASPSYFDGLLHDRPSFDFGVAADTTTPQSSSSSSSTSPEQRLLDAINKEKVSDVRRLLKHGTKTGLDLNAIKVQRKKEGQPAATANGRRKGHQQRVKNEFPWEGWRPLHVAAWRGRCEIIQALLDAGAEVNCRNDAQQTALHIAALRGHVDAARLLLCHGALVDAPNPRRFNQTPLQIASLKGHARVIELLLSHEANINAQNGNPTGPRSPLQLATRNGHLDAIQTLIYHDADLNTVENGYTIMTTAALHYNALVVDYLCPIVYNRDVAAQVKKNELDVATQTCNAELLTKLLQNGCLNRMAHSSEAADPATYLKAAIVRGHLDVVRTLLPFCPSGSLDNQQGAVIRLAAAQDNADIVETLLRTGVSPNVDASVESPLSIATRKGFASAVYCLLEHGADANRYEQRDGNSAIHIAAEGGHLEIVRMLANKTTNLNKANSFGQAPLHMAANAGHQVVLSILLEAGADVNLRNRKRYGQTALHFAAAKGHLSCVETLIQAGADVNAKKTNRVGPQTALEMARSKGHKDVEDALRRMGAEEGRSHQNAHDHITTSVQLLTFDDEVPEQFSYVSTSSYSTFGMDSKLATETQARSPPVTASSTTATASYYCGPWKTVRLFLSSTFADMHSERDHLVKHVIPKLREKCAQRKLHLVDVDLRWGVTEEESKSGKVLALCLSEISNCEIFCGLLGERYGWVPSWDDVPIDVKLSYAWQRDASVTEMEIQHGALRRVNDPNCCALFYLRDSSRFVKRLPAQWKKVFQEEDQEKLTKQQQLREMVKSTRYPCFDYSPGLDECQLGQVPKLIDLEAFGERFFADVWAIIDQKYPYNPLPPDPMQLERALHEEFKETRNRNFVGRSAVVEEIMDYIRGANNKPLVVQGEPGSGKSAIMGHIADKCAREIDMFVITHFVGGTPSSTSVRQTLLRFCHEIKTHFGFWTEINSDSFEDLKRSFADILEETARDRRKVLIVMDALNQLDHSDRSHDMDWLPRVLPEGVKMVMSCLQGDCLNVLLQRNVPIAHVGALTPEDSQEIVIQTLNEYQKKLQADQMESLMRKKDSCNPLYLVVACEELRVFGSFEKVKSKIQSMAETVPALFDQVLVRLEEEHGKTLVRDALALLASSRHGLLEIEMLDLLGVNSSIWSSLYLSLKLFLRPIGKSGEGVLDFFHRQLAKAVHRNYLSVEEDARNYHERLANYFMAKSTPLGQQEPEWQPDRNPRAILELPYHLTLAAKWDQLGASLANLKFMEAKCLLGGSYGLVEDYLRVQRHKGDGTCPAAFFRSREIEKCGEFVLRNIHVLSSHSKLVLQQLVNFHDEEFSAVLYKEATEILQMENRPYVLWTNKPKELADLSKLSFVAQSEVNCVSFSPDGQKLLTAYKDGSLRVWNIQTGQELNFMRAHEARVTACQYSPCGKYFVSSSGDGTVKSWDAQSCQLLTKIVHHDSKEVLCCSFTRDGKYLASGGEDGELKLWHASALASGSHLSSSSPYRVLRGHTAAVSGCNFSPCGRFLVTTSYDKTAVVWDISGSTSRQYSVLIGHTKIVNACSFSMDGELIATAGQDKTVKIWDKSGTLQTTLAVHSDNVFSCQFSNKDRILLTGSWDKTIIAWDVRTPRSPRLLATIGGHGHFVNSVAFSSSNEWIASGSVDMSAKLFDASSLLHARFSSVGTPATLSNDEQKKKHKKMIRALHFCSAKDILATGSWDKTVKIWTKDGRLLSTISGHAKRVNACRFSPDGSKLASGSMDSTLKVWDTDTGDELITLNGHSLNVFCCAFSHNGQYLVSGSADKTLRLWDVESGDTLGILSGHQDWVTAVAFAPFSRRIVSGSKDGTLRIWNSVTGEGLETIQAHTSTILDVKFSSDGRYIVSVAEDKTIRVWDGFTYEEKQTLRGHSHEVTAVAFMPSAEDGTCSEFIASASSDKSVRLWHIPTGEERWCFFGSSAVMSLDVINNTTLAAGDSLGNMYILRLYGPMLEEVGDGSIHCLDLRVGHVLQVRKHENADTLYVSQVDLGESKPRQVVSGLVKHLSIHQLQGEKVVVLCNVKPSRLKGIESQAMIVGVSANDPSARPAVELLLPPQDAPVGDRLFFGPNPPPQRPLETIDFKDVMAAFGEELRTDARGQAHYRDQPLLSSSTGAGCFAPSIRFGHVA
ncbi:Telomerase protein component 1 [Balamuthia mandrillaris]